MVILIDKLELPSLSTDSATGPFPPILIIHQGSAINNNNGTWLLNLLSHHVDGDEPYGIDSLGIVGDQLCLSEI